MKGSSLIKAIKDTLTDNWESLTEGGDLIWSAATEGGLLEEIPLVSIGAKFLNARDQLQEHRFRRNCQALLLACEKVDNETKRETLEKLSADPELLEDFADTLLQIACDSSKPYKASIVGNLLAAMLSGRIDYLAYDRLTHIVYSASIPALQAFQRDMASTAGNPYIQNRSFGSEPLMLSMGIASRYGNKLTISDDGILLYRFGFAGWPNV